MIDWTKFYASRMDGIVPSDIRELGKRMSEPGMISFGGGIPEPSLFPADVLADAYRRVLSDPKAARVALQYSDTNGYFPLREYIAQSMATLGVTCGPEHVMVVSGSQQALDFVGRLFISPGDTVLVEAPTYLGALRAFDSYEARYATLPGPYANAADIEGADAGRVKFGYVMPDFQNPTGNSLTRSERERTLDLAAELDIPLFEDNAYEKLRYSGEPTPTLLALDAARSGGLENGRTIYASTFSKTIAPGLRIGWIVAPTSVLRKIELIKQGSDIHASTLHQMVLHDVAPTLLTEAYFDKIRDLYRSRRDATLEALAKHMPDGVRWNKPEGGMFIWVTLPAHMDSTALAKRALEEFKIGVIAGKTCYGTRPETNTLRLAFSLVPDDKAFEGARRLGQAIRAMGA